MALLNSTEKISVAESFLPEMVLSRVECKDPEERLGEKTTCMVISLLANVILETAKAMRKKDLKAFDANPGDSGCQGRAVALFEITQNSPMEELEQLEKEAKKIKELVNGRKNKKICFLSKPAAFFKEVCSGLKVSKNVEYLLHCRLLTILRVPYAADPIGFALTRTEVSRLSMLVNNIGGLDLLLRRKIVEESQQKLSKLTIEAVHEIVQKLDADDLTKKMTSLDHALKYNEDPEKYEERYFGCLFFHVKGLLQMIKEKNLLLGLRCFGAEPKILLYKVDDNGKFAQVQAEQGKVIIFDVKLNDRAALNDLEKNLLIQASLAPPYHPKSTPSDIKDLEARKTVEELRQKKNDGIVIDHVYLNMLENELAEKAKQQARLRGENGTA